VQRIFAKLESVPPFVHLTKPKPRNMQQPLLEAGSSATTNSILVSSATVDFLYDQDAGEGAERVDVIDELDSESINAAQRLQEIVLLAASVSLFPFNCIRF
jgi:hypothetical protein